MSFAEIYQETEPTAAQSELSQNLLAVNRCKLLNGFQFNNHFAFNYEIGPKAFVERKVVIVDRNRYLTFSSNTLSSQFVSENNLVDRLEKTGPEPRVNFERTIQNNSGKLIFIQGNSGLQTHERYPVEMTSVSQEDLSQHFPFDQPNLCDLCVLCVRPNPHVLS